VENLKSEVYYNHYTFDELQQNICEIITSLKIRELRLVSILSRNLGTDLHAGSTHFEGKRYR
jgi:hypothetical protein